MDIAVSASKTNIDTGKVSVLINCNTTGFGQPFISNEPVTIFPNPASCDIRIASTINDQLIVEIYSSAGELVMHKSILPQENLSIAALASGIYAVKIISEDKNYMTKKLQVIK